MTKPTQQEYRIPLDRTGRIAALVLPTPITKRDAELVTKWVKKLLLPVLNTRVSP